MSEPEGLTSKNRSLNPHEKRLMRWMLEHGNPEGATFLHQLELAKVTPWRCPCRCASINFEVDGHPAATGGMQVVADFVFGDGDELNGIFVYAQDGMLAGLEVYGIAGDAPRLLPEPEVLRPFSNPSA